MSRRDPFWDMEGRGVRRARRMRKILKILVLVAVVILAVVVVRPVVARALTAYPDVDAWLSAFVVTVSDPFKIAGAILLGAAAATAMMYIRRVRRVRAIRR
jgi:hypothetical protein